MRSKPFVALVAATALALACSGTTTEQGAAPPAAPPAQFDAAAQAAAWPQWRGADRSGVSAETGLLQSWPAGGPRLLWTARNAGDGFSSVSIQDGRLYTMGERDDGEYVIAYDLRDGSEVWSTRTAAGYDNDKGGGPRATPTIDGDRLYTLGARGDLSCLSTGGEVVWQVNVLQRFGGRNVKWGISESPLVDERRVYALTGSAAGSLVALDKTTGELVWQSAGLTDPPGYASALMVEVGGVRQIVHFTDRALVGVAADDGRLLWRHTGAANDTANCTTPLLDADRVFYTSGYDTGAALLQLVPDGDGTAAREVYFTREMRNHHGGVVLIDGNVYGFDNKKLACLELATGRTRWSDRSVGKGSLVGADGRLYVVGEKGTIALVEVTPVGYREKGRFQIDVRGGRSWAHPVVVGGRFYVRNGDEIYCYDVRA